MYKDYNLPDKSYFSKYNLYKNVLKDKSKMSLCNSYLYNLLQILVGILNPPFKFVSPISSISSSSDITSDTKPSRFACCNFSITYITIKKVFRNSPCMTCNGRSKVAVQHPPLNEGLALIDPFFYPTSSTYQRQLKLGLCLEIDDRRSSSKFCDVT